MKHRLLFIIIILPIAVKSQNNLKLWEKLFHVKDKSFTIINHADPIHLTTDSLINEHNISPFVANNKVYAWIAGTGKIFELVTSPKNSIIGFKRIDSTIHTGNNFDSFIFDYNHQIYSLGGYGFWRRNGQLKTFDTSSNEWQIVPLNDEIPVSHSNTSQPSWYDPVQGKVFLIGYSEVNESKGNNISYNDVMQLDLKSKKWEKLGILSDEFTQLLDDRLNYSINKFPISIVSLPWGILVRVESHKIYLLDIYNNEIKELNDNKKFSQALSVEKYTSHFYVDSFYYAFDPITKNIDSLRLSVEDFKPTGLKIYTKKDSIVNYLIAGLFILIFPVAIYWKRKKKKMIQPMISEISTNNLENPILNTDFIKLDNSELNILEVLIRNSKLKKHTTIDDLNKTLGLSKKNINIQKKQRSDLIISLNRKLSFLTLQKEDIIIKKRNLIDKRSFDYFIEPDFLDIIMKYYMSIKANSK